ncbi:MAG: TIGR00730 family Rossman fold protein [Candidatus Zambryskibacteria bacterium]|nr:TIGR00730 family Rossman fold protein [Candidatus Zambryskibacteria bacterium]
MDKEKINLETKRLPIKPLTRQELYHSTTDRLALINEEFKNGFEFLRKHPKSVTVFGGGHFTEKNSYYISARSLGSKIANELRYAVFTGGGPGIMEAANRGAFEVGGQSIGLTIELEKLQVENPYLTSNIGFHYFFSRKVCLSFSAEAYVFFPGGYGTLNEFFEIITLVQTKKIERVPVILFGSDFWNPIREMMKKELLSRAAIDKDDLSLFKITDSESEVIKIIQNSPIRNGIKFTHPEVPAST